MSLDKIVDLKALKKEGFLSEKDYQKITEKLSFLFPFNIKTIRKIMNFQPVSYVDYQHAVASFEEIMGSDVDNTMVYLPYHIRFSMDFFPRFYEEYINPLRMLKEHSYAFKERDDEIFKELHESDFNSLTMASYEIKKTLMDIFDEKGKDLEVDLVPAPQFLVLEETEGGSNIPIRIELALILMPAD
ncbi:MAG: hypothetical protein HQK56_21200 [Deltaproteobacteria bacterium]|nr:hypothetical protein [Deltaproteobacteria bacterium]